MLAQWISIAAQESFRKARTEPLITLGAAPLSEPGFLSVVLGQLGKSRLIAAINTDIAGEQAHSKALDADTKGPLRDIHRRVGTAILFESSGGQSDEVAHLPELRFALGEPELATTSIDNAALVLEGRCSTSAHSEAEHPARSRADPHAGIGLAARARTCAQRQHDGPAPRRYGSARGLESAWDEDPAEAAGGL